jgi:predicted transcriptional regulator
MKTKKIKIGCKDIRATLDDFVDTGEAPARGEQVREEAGVYFTNIEAFRKAITPRRLELLNIIETARPGSINQLASLVRRNIKNVAEDVNFWV